LVEHLTIDPLRTTVKIQPPLVAKRKELKKDLKNWPTMIAQLVKNSITDPETEGSNPAATQLQKKTTANKWSETVP